MTERRIKRIMSSCIVIGFLFLLIGIWAPDGEAPRFMKTGGVFLAASFISILYLIGNE